MKSKSIKEQFRDFLKENLFAIPVLAYSFFSFLSFNISEDIIFFIIIKEELNFDKIIIEVLFPVGYFLLSLIIITVFKDYLKIFLISALAFIQALLIQVFFTKLDIVYTSWAVILSALPAVIIYLDNYNFFKNDIYKLEKISDSNKRYEFGKYLYNEIRFIFDRSIQTFFIIITMLGVEETILWTLYNEPKYYYEKVLSISIYLVIGFVLTIIPLISWVMYPAFLKLKELKYVIVDIKNND